MAKYNKLEGKHVLVIGGSKGIGRGVAEASLESGARVTISGSSQSSADATVAEIKALYPSAQIAGVGCDLSQDTVEQDLEALLQKVREVNHLVYTAADRLKLGKLETFTLDEIHKASHMRLVVPVMLGKLAARYLPKSYESSLTLTTGAICDKPAPGWTLIAYFSAGLTGLTRNLALDLAPIRVNVVEPGVVDTGIWDDIMTPEQRAKMLSSLGKTLPLGRAGEVEDVAEAYLYSMKDRNSTGEVIKTRSGGHL
ncbi:short-chain dehydrogenase [Xylariales sp. PMI_506]|nr:short-chain dehydrogenase [Xylariales sp. PMI_506]